MTLARLPTRLADQRDQIVPGRLTGRARAGVPGFARLVDLSSRYPCQTDLGFFCAPDRAIAVPDPSWRAAEAGAGRDCRDEEEEHGGSIESVITKPSAGVERTRHRPAGPKDWAGGFQLMSVRCFLGFHRPALNAISRRPEGYVSMCEVCARPLERTSNGRWVASAPLDQGRTT